MSFDEYETSEDEGRLVELYTFSGSGLSTIRQTSGDAVVDLGGANIYTPTAIRRTATEISSDPLAEGGIELTVTPDHPIAELYRVLVPAFKISVRITALHLDDSAEETDGIFLGQVRSVGLDGDQAIIRCEPFPATLQREGLGPADQRTCPWQVYDGNCRAVIGDFTITGMVSGVSGNDITAAIFDTEDDGWLDGGMVTIDGDQRLVKTHVGDTVTLLFPFDGAAAGLAVTATAGCDRSKATCTAKFNNLVNFGGAPYLPDKNPFQVGLDG